MAVCEMWCQPVDLKCEKGKYSTPAIEEAILGASEVLSHISYHRYGVCEYMVAPALNGCSKPSFNKRMGVYLLKPQVGAGKPIVDITAINIIDAQGNVTQASLDPIWWELDTIFFPRTYTFPTQTPGPIGANSSWHIVLTAGKPIPKLGKIAAVDLALKLLEEGGNSEGCELPPNLVRMVRQGGEYEMLNEKDSWANIPSVTMFRDTFGRRKRWAGVMSPLKTSNQLVQ